MPCVNCNLPTDNTGLCDICAGVTTLRSLAVEHELSPEFFRAACHELRAGPCGICGTTIPYAAEGKHCGDSF